MPVSCDHPLNRLRCPEYSNGFIDCEACGVRFQLESLQDALKAGKLSTLSAGLQGATETEGMVLAEILSEGMTVADIRQVIFTPED